MRYNENDNEIANKSDSEAGVGLVLPLLPYPRPLHACVSPQVLEAGFGRGLAADLAPILGAGQQFEQMQQCRDCSFALQHLGA